MYRLTYEAQILKFAAKSMGKSLQCNDHWTNLPFLQVTHLKHLTPISLIHFQGVSSLISSRGTTPLTWETMVKTKLHSSITTIRVLSVPAAAPGRCSQPWSAVPGSGATRQAGHLWWRVAPSVSATAVWPGLNRQECDAGNIELTVMLRLFLWTPSPLSTTVSLKLLLEVTVNAAVSS